MAYTVSDLSLAAGYTREEALDFLGEGLSAIGLMTTATDWYDSFSVTNASGIIHIRVIEEVVDASKAFGSIYHIFFVWDETSSSVQTHSNCIFYGAMYSGWDTTNHKGLGEYGLDFAGYQNWDDPVNWTASSISQFYATVIEMQNAGPFELKAFTKANEAGYIKLKTPSEYAIMGHIPTNVTYRDPSLLDAFGPMPIYSLRGRETSATYVMFPHLLPRAITGKASSMTSYSTRGALASSTYVSWADYSSGSRANPNLDLDPSETLGMHPEYTVDYLPDFAEQAPYNHLPRYQAVGGITLFGPTYDGLTLGSEAFYFAGYNQDVSNSAAFVPERGDTIIVNPGVEEYYVLDAPGVEAVSSSLAYNVVAFIMRTV